MTEIEKLKLYMENIQTAPEEILPKAMEEMAELIQQLAKLYTGGADLDAVAEELADVRIMTDQLEILIGQMDGSFPSRVSAVLEDKLRRQTKRVEERKCETVKHTLFDSLG